MLRPVIVRLQREQALLAARCTDPAQHHVRAELGDLASRLEQVSAEAVRQALYLEAIDLVLDEALLRALPDATRTVRRGGSARAICSLANGRAYRSLLSRSAISFERYAERWDWDLVLSTEELSEGRPASWAKIPFIRSLLDEYEWVLWLDADVVITDLEADIAKVIRPEKDLYLVEHNWGEYTANAGVMLLRSTDWSREFLDAVWTHPDAGRDRRGWWENEIVLRLLGYSLEPARLVEPTPWLARTELIDKRWNDIYLDPTAHPAFVHRGFYDTATRSRQVTADLAGLLAA